MISIMRKKIIQIIGDGITKLYNEKKDKIRMKRLSETDALTGLYNRSTLFHRIESTLQHSGKPAGRRPLHHPWRA